MPNIAPSQPFPNDSWKPPKDCSFVGPSEAIRQIQSVYPVDEMEEFQDPFSDLNLFLCKKINEVMHKKGGIKNWNYQIEKDVLQRILPEFKLKFPYYRLGIAALKRTWEKISYYQKKVIYGEAYHVDGKLNINYLIKENIRSYQQNYKQSPQYYYDQIPTLANNLCECIAILEGKQPNVVRLRRTIWAVVQHLLPPAAVNTLPIEKELDTLDHFLCKNMLYHIYRNPTLSCEKLKELIRTNCIEIFQHEHLENMEKLATIISILLSKSYMARISIPKRVKTTLNTCIENHIDRIYRGRKDSSITFLSFVQNMLSIFSLTPSLPKNYDPHKLRIAIRLITQEKSRSFLSYFPNFDATLYAFIKIQSILLKERKRQVSKEQLEEDILCSYIELCNVSDLPFNTEILEIILWHNLDRLLAISYFILPKTREFLFLTIEDNIIEQPQLNFAQQVRATTYNLKKIREVIVAQPKIEEKIEYFCLQNEMACRFMSVEKQSYLWEFLQKSIGRGFYKKKKQILKEVVKMSISFCPVLSDCIDHLVFRIHILYTYMWYQDSCKTMNTFSAFIQKQNDSIPRSSYDKRQVLRERITALLPVTPFSDKEILPPR